MPIHFPPLEVWDGLRMIVTFPANGTASRTPCLISIEALQDHYGASLQDPLSAFRANRASIEQIASSLIGRGRHEPDGSILIRTADCP